MFWAYSDISIGFACVCATVQTLPIQNLNSSGYDMPRDQNLVDGVLSGTFFSIGVAGITATIDVWRL